jgi:predicted exporter
MIKYANFIILFILLSVGLLLKDNIHISTNLLSLFATKESVEKLNIANNLGYSKEMLIAVKGFDKRAKEEVRQISKELKKLKYINFVQSSIVPTQEIQEYYKKYYPILATFDDANITQEQVSQKLQALYDAQLSSVFYSSINKNDPLSLFELQNIKRTGISNKGEFIALGEYGLLVRVMTDISPSQMNEAKELYRDVHTLLSKYPEVVAFAPFFYTVENSTKIQEDVQWIIILSTVVLLLIYYLLIKNIRLLSQTVIALFSSMVFASLVSTMFIENFNILSLAFGMSLTAVSIDYLLHYHFHNFYATSQKIDKNVLYGYLTTVIAFGIFSFIPIPLAISEI